MTGRNCDNKIRILKENGFIYTGDKYIHISSGLEVWCSDLDRMEDDDFVKAISLIMGKIKKFEDEKQKTFYECQEILNKMKTF